MSYLDALAQYTEDGQFGSWSSTTPNIFVGPPPDNALTPDVYVALIDRPGGKEETFTTSRGIPRLTVECRGAANDNGTPENAAWALWNYYELVANETLHGQLFLRLDCTTTPAQLHQDSSSRFVYAFDMEIWLG